MKKMLAILGSPRKNGNVAKMLGVAMAQAKKLDYEITFVNLYEKEIKLCQGCMYCKQTGICRIQDDIQQIRKEFIESDLIVIATPTYFANVPGLLKNMFDRLVATVMDDNNSSIPKSKLSKKHKYVILATCNTPFPFDRFAKQSTGCVRAVKEVCHISGMKYGGKVVFAGTRNAADLPERIQKQIIRVVNRI